MPNTDSTVFIYNRVSTEDQAENGFNLEAMKGDCYALARQRGFHDSQIVYLEDVGSAGYVATRLRFREMCAVLSSGDLIIAWAWDRLFRNMADQTHYVQDWHVLGINVALVHGSVDIHTNEGRLTLNIQGAMSEFERGRIGERATSGQKRGLEEGYWQGGKPPLGYRRQPVEEGRNGRPRSRLVPDEQQAALYREIVKRYIGGMGVRILCNWLNHEAGIRPSRGRRWYDRSIARILSSPIYIGLAVRGQHKLVKGANGKGRLIATTPWVSVDNFCEPLIDRGTWDQVQALLKRRRELAPRTVNSVYPLTGVAMCGKCGTQLHGHREGTKRRRRSYRCINRQYGECDASQLRADRVEDAFVAALELFTTEADCEALLPTAGLSVARQLETVSQAIRDHERMQVKWDVAYEKEAITLDKYREMVRPHQEAIAALWEARIPLEEQAAQFAQVNPREVYLLISKVRDVWSGATPAERKAMCLELRHMGIRAVTDRYSLTLKPAPELMFGVSP